MSDNELEEAEHQYPENPPRTKEAYLYRRIFDSFYSNCAHLAPYLWLPRWSKATDPSSRFIDNYQERGNKTPARDDHAVRNIMERLGPILNISLNKYILSL